MSCFKLATLALAIGLAPLVPRETSAETTQPIRRFALIVGVNSGGKGRLPLRYAHADAEAVARVLRQLGGVEPGDLTVEKEPDRLRLQESLEGIRRQLAAATGRPGRRVELLFYYSGHSDEEGLLLGGQRFEYARLRSALAALPASVRIAVLDSCASGALTRGKGGRRRAPFLVDRSSDIRGHAYLTSASSTENAQESDRMRGSFFTHFLVAGLRGAADTNRDGRVTLNEAYNHAFHETLARTESTRSGPQHPNYDMQLAGSGDLVLTDLRGTSALMVLAPELRGRLFIRDAAGRLVAELGKSAGHPMTLGLEPGRYQITLEHERQVRRGSVTLAKDQRTLIQPATLGIAVALESTRARGGDTLVGQALLPIVRRPVSVSFAPGLSNNASTGASILNHFSLNFTVERADLLRGMELSLVGSIRSLDVDGLQIGGAFQLVRGRLRGIQIGGAFNTATLGGAGLQLSGAVSWAGPFAGIQIANVLNHVGGGFGGLQISGAVNLAGPTDGLQLGLGLNLARGPLRGMQIGGAVNLASAASGLQLGGAFNQAGERAAGAQISGALNLAGSLSGMQLAPINLAGSVRGLQVGLVNLAGEARGVQIGLVNLARKDKGLVPIGLLNLVGDGILAPSFWSSGSSLLNLGLKLGGRRVYGLLGVGLHPGDKEDQRLTLIAGLGAELPLSERFFLDLDAVLQEMGAGYGRFDELDLSTGLRVAVGFRLLPQLSVFAGPTLELLASRVRDKLGYVVSLWEERTAGGTALELGLGFLVGVQVTPRWGRLNRR